MTDFKRPPSPSFRRVSRLAAVCGALAALSTAPAAAETLKAHYALSLLGLSIGSAYASGVIEPQNYRLDIAMKTTGLANLVNNTRGAATATGKLNPEGPSPASFANTLANSYETRTIRMSLGGNAVRASRGEARAVGRRATPAGERGAQAAHHRSGERVDHERAGRTRVGRPDRLQPHDSRIRRRDAFRRAAQICRNQRRRKPRDSRGRCRSARRITRRSPATARTAP